MANTAEKQEVVQDSTAAAGSTAFTGTHGSLRSVPLSPDEEYDMKHKRRGLALIFNQFHFDDDLYLKDRRGSEVDCQSLNERLKHLGFEVNAYENKKQKEVKQIITKAAQADHSDADCFVLVFLSHGKEDHVYTYDDKISIKEITDEFKGTNCKSLVGKPKIFIWQACRGEKHDDAVTPCAIPDDEPNDMMVDEAVVQTLPAGADFIMCYSVAEGYFSHRHTIEGSWYIQDLCELLKTYGESLEFTHLLTMVNRKVSMRSIDVCRDFKAIGKKQAPCFASMLTKKLYFHSKK